MAAHPQSSGRPGTARAALDVCLARPEVSLTVLN